MHSRVLRSSTLAIKRSLSNVVVKEEEELVTTVAKKIKRSPKVKLEEEVENNIQPITYYEAIANDEDVPELPHDFVNAHQPQFIEGLRYLIKKEPSFHKYIIKAHFPSFTIDKNDVKRDDHYYFESLISGIISQQISGKAALSIKQKLIDNLSTNSRLPSAHIFNNRSVEELRSLGLSERKLLYVKLIAADFDGGILSKTRIENLTDEDVYDLLIAYKGIGPWSVIMFLMFSLKRLNAFTATDLGVLRGASRYLNERNALLQQIKRNTIVKTKKKEFKNRKWVPVAEECVQTLSQEFEPYKTCLMLVFWRMSDINIDALET